MSARRPGVMLAAAASLAMAAAVAGGLWMIGSPVHQRALRLDERRVAALQSVALAVHNHWAEHHALPSRLAAMTWVHGGGDVRDPVSGAPFEYAVTGEQDYRLCATFDAASEPEQPQRGRLLSAEAIEWAHPAGRYCFALRASRP